MENQTKKLKEKFLSEIDNDGFSADEKLMIAAQAFDAAYNAGTTEGAANVEGEVPEGMQRLINVHVLPSYEKSTDKELIAAGEEIIKGYVQTKDKPASEEHAEILARLRNVKNEMDSRNGGLFKKNKHNFDKLFKEVTGQN